MSGADLSPALLSFGVRKRGILRIGALAGSTRKHHRTIAIQTGDIDKAGSADAHTAAGADVFPGAGRFARARWGGPAVGACAGDLKSGEFVPVYQNVRQTVFQNKIQKCIGGGSLGPSIFFAVLYVQTVALCRFLESAVVVCPSPAAILYAELKVVIVAHFVKQGGADIFDRPGKRPRADIDFMGAAEFGDPCVFPEGKMPVSARRGLDCYCRP